MRDETVTTRRTEGAEERVIERCARALFDVREHAGVRPPVSMWPPEPDAAEDYIIEARAVLVAANYTGAVAVAEDALRLLKEKGRHAGEGTDWGCHFWGSPCHCGLDAQIAAFEARLGER